MTDQPKPRAVIVDIDGTLALRQVFGRSPFDWHRVGEDLPNGPVVELVKLIAAAGQHTIIIMSGRDAVCRLQTVMWLAAQGIDYALLLMRPAGDNRGDTTVKAELFERHIAPTFDVAFVIDDRDRVVKMWRERGLTVFQCAEGAF